jgi:flavin reductase (DIM6/NTAB) family NADH-FMN oxidoreductase RutF
LTANSFTSVSLNPPMLLFCLDHKSNSLAAFDACDAFAVNVLHIGQQDVSNRFMGKGDRWKDTGWETWDTGAPILQDAMACFECDKHQSFDSGDHRIFIGRVRRVWFDPSRDPLLYLQGGYRRVHIPR